MTFDDYIAQVTDDALEAVAAGEYDYCSDIDDVLENMWVDDSITGNGSGSYTFNACRAAENTAGLVWDDAFLQELEGMCIDFTSLLKDGPEALDVTARCLALAFVHDDVTEAWNARAC
jgi:hypothetical protein